MINVGAMVATLTLDTKKFMVGMQKVTKGIKPLQTRLAVAGQAVKKFARQIINLKTAFIALGVAMAGRAILGKFQKFQTALVDMGKVTSRSLVGVRKEVMALDTSLGTSTSLMRGYYQVISAGVKSAAQQLDVLKVATRASLAAHIDQSEVIKGLTAIVDAYEGKVRSATEAADMLFTIERLGKTTVQELIPIIGSLASISATLNITQDEMGGSLAQLTKFIGSTAEAATQLKALYTALITPNEELNALFEKQGGVLKAIEKVGFIEVLKEMDRATEGNVEALKKLMEGRREALLGFLSLAKQGFAPTTEAIAEMTNKTGAMDDAFKAWEGTLEATYHVLKASLGKVMIEIGQELAPSLQRIIKSIAKWFDDWKDTLVTLTKTMVRLVPKIAEMVIFLTSLKIVSSLVILFEGFTLSVAAAEVAILKLNTAMKANLVILGSWLSYKFFEWIGSLIDGSAKAKDETKKLREELGRQKKMLEETREAMQDSSQSLKDWFAVHDKLDAEAAAKTEVIPGIVDPDKMREMIDEANSLQMDHFDFAEEMIKREYEENQKYAGMAEVAAVIFLEKMKANDKARVESERAKLAEMTALNLSYNQEQEAYMAAMAELAAAEAADPATVDDTAALQATRSMYEDMRDYSTEYYDTVEQLIDKQAEQYKDAGAESVLVEKWVTAEKKKLSKARTKIILNETSQMMGNFAEAFKYLGQESATAFKLYKAFAISETLIKTYQGAQEAFTALAGIPIVGPALGIAAAAAAIMAGLARVAMISQEEAHAMGGWVDRHPQGGKITEGTPGKDNVFLGATPGVRHWAMKDEFVFVMNKMAARKHGSMLEAMNQGLAEGGWLDKGYGRPLHASPATGAKLLGVESEVTAALIDMMGLMSALDKELRDVNAQFKDWKKELIAIGATTEQLAWLEARRAEALEYTRIEMEREVILDVNKQILELTGALTDFQWEVIGVNDAFDQMVEDLETINASEEQLAIVEAKRAEAIQHLIDVEQEELAGTLGKRLAKLTTPDQAPILNLTEEFTETIEQIKEWADVTGEGYDDLINQAMQVYNLEMQAAIAQTDAAKEIERSINKWVKIVESLDKTIFNMQTSLTNPADVAERMNIVKDAIAGFGDVTTPEEATELQNLWKTYLDLAQDAFQRPSAEYQDIYSEALGALEELKAQAEGFVSEYEVALDQLSSLASIEELIESGMIPSLEAIATGIMEGVPVIIEEPLEVPILPEVGMPPPPIPAWPVPPPPPPPMQGYQPPPWALPPTPGPSVPGGGGAFGGYWQHGGIASGPESGYLAMLHGTEAITPLGPGRSGMGGVKVILNLNINESRTPRETGREVVIQTEAFLKSAKGRKMVQQVSIGR